MFEGVIQNPSPSSESDSTIPSSERSTECWIVDASLPSLHDIELQSLVEPCLGDASDSVVIDLVVLKPDVITDGVSTVAFAVDVALS